MSSTPPNRITTREAAERALVTTNTIRNWIKEHGIGGQIGARYYVDLGRLEAFLREHYPHMTEPHGGASEDEPGKPTGTC